jgi:hypothetical protein
MKLMAISRYGLPRSVSVSRTFETKKSACFSAATTQSAKAAAHLLTIHARNTSREGWQGLQSSGEHGSRRIPWLTASAAVNVSANGSRLDGLRPAE